MNFRIFLCTVNEERKTLDYVGFNLCWGMVEIYGIGKCFLVSIRSKGVCVVIFLALVENSVRR